MKAGFVRSQHAKNTANQSSKTSQAGQTKGIKSNPDTQKHHINVKGQQPAPTEKKSGSVITYFRVEQNVKKEKRKKIKGKQSIILSLPSGEEIKTRPASPPFLSTARKEIKERNKRKKSSRKFVGIREKKEEKNRKKKGIKNPAKLLQFRSRP